MIAGTGAPAANPGVMDITANEDVQPHWRNDRDLAGLDLENCDLVTIDVFDTLVSRTTGDTVGLHVRMEEVARDRGLLTTALPARAFARLRARLETEARDARQALSGHREVGLAEIYARLPPAFGDAGALAVLEAAMERTVLLANPFVCDLLRAGRAAGRRVWLVSDTPYDAATLAALLDGCGIGADLYERLIVSSAHAASKADGRLFDLVRREAGLGDGQGTAKRWVHIGDNPLSDVIVPRERGVQAIHYRVPQGLRQVEEQERLFGGTGALQAYRRLAARAPAPVEGDPGFWFDLGRHIIGPAVHAFCAAVVRSCRAAGVRRIAPFMREGALFTAFLQREARRQGFDADIRPLFVSREALRLPLSSGLDGDALVRMASTSSNRTLADALHPYGLEGTLPPDLAERGGRALVDLLAEPGTPDRIAAFLAEPGTRARIARTIAAAREAAVAYLRRELGEGGGEKGRDRDDGAVATVDLGARGTIQSLLGRLPGIGDRHLFHHHLLYAVPDLFANITDGHRWHVFAGLDEDTLHRARIIYRSPQLIELALLGDLPTTVGYRLDEDGPRPVLSPAAGGPEQACALDACRQGILYAGSLLSGLAETQPVAADTPITAADTLNSLFRLIQAPLPEEARAAAGLLYDLNDGIRAPQPLADADALAVLRTLDPVHPLARPTLAQHIRPALLPWPQAALTLLDENTMVRIAEAGKLDLQHRTYVRLLLELLKTKGIERVILCGAGGLAGMGPTFLETAPLAGVAVLGYFDYFRDSTARSSLPGVPALGEDDLARQPCSDFTIVSMGYAPALAAIVGRALTAEGRPHRIVMLPLHTP